MKQVVYRVDDDVQFARGCYEEHDQGGAKMSTTPYLLGWPGNRLLVIVRGVAVSRYESKPVVYGDAIRCKIPFDEIGWHVKQAER